MGRAVRRLGTLLVLAGAAVLLVRERGTVADALERIGRGEILEFLAAFALLVVGRGALALAAFVSVTGEVAGVPSRPAAVAWLRAALAKYVPGAIWHPLSAVERLHRGGAGVGTASLAMLVDVAALVVGAAIVGAPALPALVRAGSGSAWWLLLAVPALALLHPRLFAAGLHLFELLTGRSAPDVRLPPGLVARAVALHAAGWLLAGASLWFVLRGLDAPGPAGVVVPAAALSWTVGFLFVVAPAGLGVREAVLVAVVGPLVGLDAAVGAAVLSRVLHVLLDVGGAILSVPVARLRSDG